jgi:hypothetical protein
MKKPKYLFGAIIFFAGFSVIYFLLDHLNGGYRYLAEEFGMNLVVVNITLNIIMAALSAFMMMLSTAYVKLSGKEGKGTFFGSFAVLFGMLTYGCTSCVIAFFASIGITLAVAVLPLAGLPYKLIALGLLLVGFVWLLFEVKRGKCRVPKKNRLPQIKD